MHSERRCALVPEEAERIAYSYFVLPPRSLGDQLSRRASQKSIEQRQNGEPPWNVRSRKPEAAFQIPNGIADDQQEQEYHANAPPYINADRYDGPYSGPNIHRCRRPSTIDALSPRDSAHRRCDNKRKHSALSQSDSWSFPTNLSENIPHMSEIFADDGSQLFHDYIFGERGNRNVFSEVCSYLYHCLHS